MVATRIATIGVGIFLVLLTSINQTKANLIVNGSFESPAFTTFPEYRPYAAGSTAVHGWTIGLTSIDLVSSLLSTIGSADGNQFMDVNGTPGPGSITQSFATVPLSLYRLKFAYLSNAQAVTTAIVRVFDGTGDLLNPITVAPPILNWTTVTRVFVAANTTTSLQFSSGNTPNVYVGVAFDDVSVTSAHPGDFDSDGDVDGADFVAWQTNFPKSSTANLAQGDADGDGDVDGADFVVWQTNFPYTPGPATVPEPAAITLMLLCALAIVALRRR